MKQYILITMAILLTNWILFAQSYPDTLWTRIYGGERDESGHCVCQTSDGGFIIVGNSTSFNPGGLLDMYVIKTDALGDTLWTHAYNEIGHGQANSVQQTSDGNYIIAGAFRPYSASSTEMFLAKINNVGDTLWTRCFGGSISDAANSVQQTSDGGYILAGIYEFGAALYGLYLVKTDSIGNQNWSRIYTGIGSAQGLEVQQTTDGGYIVAGATNYTDSSSYFYIYLLKTNALGDTSWTRTLGGGSGDVALSVRQTPDGGYILAGYTYSYGAGACDVYLVKTNALGQVSWTRTYGGNGYEWANSVRQTADGGYIIVGSSEPFLSENKDFYIIRTNGSGDSLWTKMIGGYDEEYACSVQQTADYGFIISGSTGPSLFSDVYLVRLGTEALLKVMSPNGGEQWPIFGTATIRWLGTGFEGGVKIELDRSYSSGIWEVLVDSTANDGEEIVPVTEPLSTNCRIKVSALQAPISDVSDNNFAIAAVNVGYLALIRAGQSMFPLISWDAGTVECAQTQSQTFWLKNFGTIPITVYTPLAPTGPEFTRQITCPSHFTLNPGQYAVYNLFINYAPLSTGTHYDTLLVQTTAINTVNGYARFPLSGECIATPEAPQITITLEGNDVRLSWNPITESIYGCPITASGYLIFFAEESGGPYWYHGFTTDTTYVHVRAMQFTTDRFYEVYCYVGPLLRLESLSTNPLRIRYTRDDIFNMLLEDK